MSIRKTASVCAVAVLVAGLLTAMPAQAAPTIYEAETATISQGIVESNHAGFTGTGFVNGDNVTGSYVEWPISGAPGGPSTLTIRYANGTTIPRPMEVRVNLATISVGTNVGNYSYYVNRTQATNDNHGLGAYLIMFEQLRR